MEEVEQLSSEGEEQQEVVSEIPPDPPPLKREPAKKSLKDRVKCESCGKEMSAHCLKYSHKCKARPPDEPPKEKVEKKAVPIAKPEPKKKPTFDRAALSKALKEEQKPLKNIVKSY